MWPRRASLGMHVCILFLFCIVRLGFRLKIWPSTRACTGDTTFPISIICDPVPCLVSQNLKCLWDHEVIIYKCYSRFALLRRSEIEYHYFWRNTRHFLSLIWEMCSEYVTHFGFFVTVGKMKEVFTGNYCDLFVVPVDLSVSAKRLSSHEIADVTCSLLIAI